MNGITKVNRNYKDTMFRMLFREKENLLSLYNALNKTAYTDVEDLEITTLENAVYMNYKNDISFVFDYELMLYEHQSTVNPNMPLRDLFYVAKALQGRINEKNIYGKTLIKLPAPKFVVFYNGIDEQPEQQILRLSDAYEKKTDSPELELAVTVYNVNLGCNAELMEACHLLKEYAEYVERVRIYARDMPFREAVEHAVNYCIRNDILGDFLSKNRAEAIEVCIFEYDAEKYMKLFYQEWREEGLEEGRKEGREEGRKEGRKEGREEGRSEGEARIVQLMQILLDTGRNEDISRVLADEIYREELCRENGL